MDWIAGPIIDAIGTMLFYFARKARHKRLIKEYILSHERERSAEGKWETWLMRRVGKLWCCNRDEKHLKPSMKISYLHKIRYVKFWSKGEECEQLLADIEKQYKVQLCLADITGDLSLADLALLVAKNQSPHGLTSR